MNRESRFAFVIGFRWPNGDIGTYMLHGRDVFNGDIEEAKATLKHVEDFEAMHGKKDHKYEIYRLV